MPAGHVRRSLCGRGNRIVLNILSRAMKDILSQIHGGLIVSCQAHSDWPMYGPEIMARFARAAQLGGAVGLRASGVADITAIQQVVSLPVIGIQKHWSDDFEAFITPSWEDAEPILSTHVPIIALDAGSRTRPHGETFRDIVDQIREAEPDVLIMAEVGDLAEAQALDPKYYDLISTTLSGYTAATRGNDQIDYDLIRALVEKTGKPVVAEGHVSTPWEAAECLRAGAWSVVVGTAITRPEVITRRFVDGMKSENIH